MEEYRFYAFYVWAYGYEAKREEFDNLEEVLALVKKASDPDSGYRGLVVILGRKLEFEPCTVVETYRIKETES